MLGGNEAAIEWNPQISAHGCCQVSREQLMELIDGAQLLAANLPSLPYVPGLDDGAGVTRRGVAALARSGRPYHRINFALIENFFHNSRSLLAIACAGTWLDWAARWHRGN